MREDLTIKTVDSIDEVLAIALEPAASEEAMDTPQLWKPDVPASDISAGIE